MIPEISSFLANLSLAQIYSSLIQIILVIFATLFASYLYSKFVQKLISRADKTRYKWDDIVFSSCFTPGRIIIFTLGLSFAFELIGEIFNYKLFEIIPLLRKLLVIVAIAGFALNIIKNFEEILKKSETNTFDQNSLNAVMRLAKACVYVLVTLILLQTSGVNISGVIAFGGVGGIAIGFAAKDLLANFFGFIMIYLDKPFKVGDWISSPDRNIEGTVEQIGWRLTVIRTFAKRPLYVPNSLFSSIIVENPSRMTNRRIYENIGVRYDDIKNVANIVKQIEDYLNQAEFIEQDLTVIVNLNEFADSSVNIMIYCFTKTAEWIKFHQVKQEALLAIARIIEENNSAIAFPTTTVDLPEGFLHKN